MMSDEDHVVDDDDDDDVDDDDGDDDDDGLLRLYKKTRGLKEKGWRRDIRQGPKRQSWKRADKLRISKI